MTEQFAGRRFPLTGASSTTPSPDSAHHQHHNLQQDTMSASASQPQSHGAGHGAPVGQAVTTSGARGDPDAVSNLSDESGADGSDSDSSDDHVVNKPAPKKPKTTKEKVAAARTKTAGHFKKHWIWYLIGGLLFLAILLPILFKVVIPAVVQLIVNQQNLPILGGSFLVEGNTKLQVNLNSSFNTPLPAKTNNFTMYLYNKETPEYSPWLHLNIPALNLNGKTPFHVQDQSQTLTNGSEFTKWFGRFFDQEDITLDVRGSGAQINLGILASHPVLDKQIKFKGLNRFDGLAIQKLEFLFPPQDNKNIKGSLYLPNYSPLQLGFGDSTFNVKSGDLNVGSITLQNVILDPGSNMVSFVGNLDLNAIVSNLSPFLSSQSTALGEGKIELNVTGNNTIQNGERLTYLENILNNRTLSTRLSIITVLSDVVSGLAKSTSLVSGNSTGPENGSQFVNAISGVFSNSTLLKQVAGHWDSSSSSAQREKRAPLNEALAWNLVKMAMKMNMKKKK